MLHSRTRTCLTLAMLATCLWAAWHAGAFLVVNDPHPSDVIVVLAGETSVRPARALELLDQGYARKVFIDVPAQAKIYDLTQVQLAENYIRELPQGASVGICPIVGLSTKGVANDVAVCLAKDQPKSVLIVTSDHHTRRALSVFRHKIPGVRFSVAAAYDPSQFGPRWWTHRQWAKTFFEEWVRVLWWELIDQWK